MVDAQRNYWDKHIYEYEIGDYELDNLYSDLLSAKEEKGKTKVIPFRGRPSFYKLDSHMVECRAGG